MNLVQEVLFARAIIVEVGLAHSEGLCDHGHGGRVISVFQKEVQGLRVDLGILLKILILLSLHREILSPRVNYLIDRSVEKYQTIPSLSRKNNYFLISNYTLISCCYKNIAQFPGSLQVLPP